MTSECTGVIATIHNSRDKVAAAALSVLLAATAGAQTSSATIDACFVPASGTLYRIDTPASPAPGAPKACLSPLHTKLTWNQQGPKGDAGPVGPVGPTGPIGPIGPAGSGGSLPAFNTDFYDFGGPTAPASGFVARGTLGQGSTNVPSGGGTRLLWSSAKGALRAGTVNGTQWDLANLGENSLAIGVNTTASGARAFAGGNGASATADQAFAFGYNGPVASGVGAVAVGGGTTASGQGALAMGIISTASGQGAVAMGFNTTASGGAAVAMGLSTSASGAAAVAIGNNTTANADYSTALGSFVSTGGKSGAFLVGDVSTQTVATATSDHQFTARFAAGYRLFTNANTSAGVSLAAGGGSWQSVSDVRKKTAFRPVDGETVLAALRAMPVRTWQYRSQDASIRHMGPTAQDFRAAFALGESDTTITTVDADGVALAAARALEARTRTQGVALTTLRRENDALRTAVADVRRTNAALRTQLAVLQQRADEDRVLRTRLAKLAERLEGLDPTTRAVVARRP